MVMADFVLLVTTDKIAGAGCRGAKVTDRMLMETGA
jgi:hypothetical protein